MRWTDTQRIQGKSHRLLVSVQSRRPANSTSSSDEQRPKKSQCCEGTCRRLPTRTLEDSRPVKMIKWDSSSGLADVRENTGNQCSKHQPQEPEGLHTRLRTGTVGYIITGARSRRERRITTWCRCPEKIGTPVYPSNRSPT